MKPSQEFTYIRTYSRWVDELGRRETYPESVARFLNFMEEELDDVITPHFRKQAEKAMLNMDAMPSMRALWAAGSAAKNNSITMYNCSYMAVNDIKAFSETLFILMCGTGAGFSVEKKYIDQLPEIAPTKTENIQVIVVEDSKEGWAAALDLALNSLWRGHDIHVNYDKVRPRGARLMTMGGRASGPEPLKSLFEFARRMFEEKRAKRQRRLTPIDCLDLLNKIAEIVVVGGVRRSSEISLSDLDDQQIARAKMGEFWKEYPHRSMSNNSAVYQGRPDMVTFMDEWVTLMKSGSGERGIFNRDGAIKQMTASGRRKASDNIGTNPCGEIILRDMEFCNLSEVVVRPNDTIETLRQKVKVATMFGTWQASFTKFPTLRSQWKQNCEEERLLGVSMTGIMDHPVLNNVNDKMKKWFGELKGIAVAEAEKWCKKLDINMSTAITCVKPSGTVSQLVDCASGIHPRYAQHYIRRYRISATDPLFKMLREQGVPWHPEVGQDPNTASTMVLDFPVAAPANAKTRHDYSALQQLEHWKVVREFWAEHNPSITVYVDQDEWMETGAWVYRNFDDVCGISFLPKSNHVYQLAPYEELDKHAYDKLVEHFPKIDYSQLSKYEMEDNTDGAKSYACVGDKCEL